MREEYNGNVAFGELEPSLSFANGKEVYLSAEGSQNIEVKIINIPKVKVIISKIYESNLLFAQRYGYYPKDSRRDSDEEEYYEEDYGSSDVSMGDVVYEKEIETRTLPKFGNSRLFTFNVDDRLPDFKVIYHHIKIRPPPITGSMIAGSSPNLTWVSSPKKARINSMYLPTVLNRPPQ